MTPRTLDEARERLLVLDELIPKHERDLAQATAMRSTLQQRLDALGRRRNKDQAREAAELEQAIRQLGDGIRRDDGIAFAELAPFVARMGIHALQRKVQTLSQEAEHLRQYVEAWSATPLRPHRYTGPADLTTLHDRVLEPGDVVALTATQAHAWSDRFALVEEDVNRDSRTGVM